MPKTIHVKTGSRVDMLDITSSVQKEVSKAGVPEGICMIYVPHTTAGITVNENADPAVTSDLLHALDQLVPHDDPAYRHAEGNSAAHLKSSLIGCDQTLLVADGRLLLGTWQGVYFCEFDGPRRRTATVTVIPG